jgi:hypothetical protein
LGAAAARDETGVAQVVEDVLEEVGGSPRLRDRSPFTGQSPAAASSTAALFAYSAFAEARAQPF